MWADADRFAALDAEGLQVVDQRAVVARPGAAEGHVAQQAGEAEAIGAGRRCSRTGVSSVNAADSTVAAGSASSTRPLSNWCVWIERRWTDEEEAMRTGELRAEECELAA